VEADVVIVLEGCVAGALAEVVGGVISDATIEGTVDAAAVDTLVIVGAVCVTMRSVIGVAFIVVILDVARDGDTFLTDFELVERSVDAFVG
jgi:hypothetical protein